MIVPSQAVAKMQEGRGAWVGALIAAVSACVVTLFICEPSLLAKGLFVLLTLAALLRFDFFVYASVFLLPWCPLVDLGLPVRDVFLVFRLVLFVGMWIRLRSRGRSIHEWLFGSKLKKGMVLFAGIAIASVLLSGLPANLESSRSLILLASYIAAFFAIDGWLENKAQLVRVLKLLLISTIGVALFGFYQEIEGGYTDLYFRLYPLQEEGLEPWTGRITSLLFHFNSLAGYLNLVIPFAIACAVLAKDRALKFLGLVCACAAAAAVVMTQSRGGLLALVGILIIAVWFLAPRLISRIKLLCGGLLACMLLLPPLLNHFERLQGIDEATQSGRTFLWLTAARLFLAHPFLGVGYGNYRFLYVDFVPRTGAGVLDAHNIYLQLLAETGLAGFLSFFILLGLLFSLSFKSIHGQALVSRIIAFGVFGAIAATLIHGMVDFLFRVSPQFGALFWIVLGLGSRAMAGTTNRMISKTVPS
jgi:O-antigen ligase